MTKQKLNRIGFITAAVTFIIASFIMFAHYQGYRGDYERYGLLFIPFAFIVNVIVLIIILVVANKKGIKGPFRSIYAMLLNIPYSIFCLWFAIFLMGYYRVTIINDTKSKITNIKLTGCDSESVKSIESGESETVWIDINNDCSLHISFVDKNGVIQTDIVAGYLCSGMGQSDDYHISGRNNPKY